MKISFKGLLVLGVSLVLIRFAWADSNRERSERLLAGMSLLPADDEIPGWKRSEKSVRVSTEEGLYKIFNGGAALYLKYGCISYVGQRYIGPEGLELEVYIFDLGTPENALDLFEDPFAKPSHSKEIGNVGEQARIDMTPLFCIGVDFIQKGYFLRVVVQDKTEHGLNIGLSFAKSISKRIE